MKYTPFKAGGALTDEDSAVYIERTFDREALIHLQAMDYILVIESRQQGKTSLFNHLMRHPALGDTAFIYLDATSPDRSSEAAWYRSLCTRILRQLRSTIAPTPGLVIPQKSVEWRDFLYELALAATDAHRRIVIAIDEIGSVSFPGATEFFSVLRDIYNSRQAETEFKHITFMLIGAFHPRELIKDDKISPFNIAHRVRLHDFTLEQIHELVCKGFWYDDQTVDLATRIFDWTDGQPYLTQQLCCLLAPEATPADVDANVERLRREDENHLPPILERLKHDGRLRKYIDRIRSGEQIKFYPRENSRQAELELLGIIKSSTEGLCRIRNRIYHQILESSEQLSEPPSDVVPAEPWSSSAQQADAERRATLSQLLDTHKGNLDHLHKQQASHGLTPPLAVLNQLAHEEREIKRIEAELRLLDAAPEH